jgi:hypothetical protein
MPVAGGSRRDDTARHGLPLSATAYFPKVGARELVSRQTSSVNGVRVSSTRHSPFTQIINRKEDTHIRVPLL